MRSIFEFLAIFTTSILNHIIGAFFYSKRPDYMKSFTVTENLLRDWGSSISAIFVVVLVASNQPDGLASIGILTGQSSAVTNLNAILIGLISISLLVIAIAYGQKFILHVRKKEPETKIDVSNPAVGRVLQYRDISELIAYLSVLPFIVISEDLVYRGYLVLLLGNRTHTFIPWIILSIILSIIVHLYQGRKINYMALIAISSALFIGLTIATGNILAPIAGHLFYDLSWAVGIWKKGKHLEPQPGIALGKKKKFAYSVFIGFNVLLLYVSFLLISHAK